MKLSTDALLVRKCQHYEEFNLPQYMYCSLLWIWSLSYNSCAIGVYLIIMWAVLPKVCHFSIWPDVEHQCNDVLLGKSANASAFTLRAQIALFCHNRSYNLFLETRDPTHDKTAWNEVFLVLKLGVSNWSLVS